MARFHRETSYSSLIFYSINRARFKGYKFMVIKREYFLQTRKAVAESPALSDIDRKRPQSSSPTSEATKRLKASGSASPPKERRKKSLPVRKLLEMERSQGQTDISRAFDMKKVEQGGEATDQFYSSSMFIKRINAETGPTRKL